MKRFPFLQVAVMVTLMVVAVSCGMPRSAAGGYYEEDELMRRNSYYGNPYNSNVIVVERDPFTGRYYQVTPYGATVNPFGLYATPYDSRNYNNRSGYYNNNSVYNRGNNNVIQRGQSEEQRRESVKTIEDARESILGKKRN